MFTGIVEELGNLKNIEQKTNLLILTIGSKIIIKGLKRGDSVSVNGICLTVTDVNKNSFKADVMKETVQKTNIKRLNRGDNLNLEKALSTESLLGGHIVTGHIDGTGSVKSITKENNVFNVEIEANPDILKYLVEKGSIAVNGVSLTLGRIEKNSFWIYLIPETIKSTNLSSLKKGDEINLETDILGKYIYKFTGEYKKNPKVDYNLLTKAGFIKGV